MRVVNVGDKIANDDYSGAALEAGKQSMDRIGDLAENKMSDIATRVLPKIGARVASGASMALAPSEIGTNAESESLENPMSKEYQNRKHNAEMVKPNAPDLDEVLQGKQELPSNIPMEAPRKRERFKGLMEGTPVGFGVRG